MIERIEIQRYDDGDIMAEFWLRDTGAGPPPRGTADGPPRQSEDCSGGLRRLSSSIARVARIGRTSSRLDRHAVAGRTDTQTFVLRCLVSHLAAAFG